MFHFRSLTSAFLVLTTCAPHSGVKIEGPLISGGIRYQEVQRSLGANFNPWWRGFSDATLSNEINSALSGNLAQQQLGSRIQQASASLRAEGAALFPQIDLDTSASLDQIDPGVSNQSASLGGLISWEVDLWSRVRSGVRAREQELNATIQEWLGGRLMLSAAVAETRFLVLEQRARLDVLQQQIETNETLLGLVRLRAGQGVSSRVDLLQQERQLDATRALVPPAEAELIASSYALDVLTGRPPGKTTRDSRKTLPNLPALPTTGVPSDLLKNRPDLLAKWNGILALDAEVAQALAERMPRIILSASLDAGTIDNIRSVASAILAEATAPLADGGRRRAEIDRRRAVLEEALLDYSNSYLEAIRDVETALVRERKQRERIHLTERQLSTARETLEETRIRYSQGLTDYLPVIDALNAVQSLELSMVTFRRQALTLRIALHRALGGPMPQAQP